MKFLDPKNDIAFKKIFGNEHHKNLTINFLKHANTLKDIPKKLQDLQEAFNILDELQWNDADLQDYTEKQETIDRERRQQEGSYQEGEQKGAQKKAEDFAIKLLKKGISINEVSELTELSIKQIDMLRKKMNLK